MLCFQINVTLNWVGPTLLTQSCLATEKHEQVLFCLFTQSYLAYNVFDPSK